jgi:hypothetical protein
MKPQMDLQIDYLIVQPAMFNRKEYKLVFFNKTFMYIANINLHRSNELSFSKGSHARLIAFAYTAIDALATALPDAIIDGLLRVDIMETHNRESFIPDETMSSFNYIEENGVFYRTKIVVNEFESLQADHPGVGYYEISELLVEYWKKSLCDNINYLLPPAI